LIEMFRGIPSDCPAAFFVVQHGPTWMLETFSLALERETGFKFSLADEGMVPERGHAYLSPGDRHLYIRHGAARLGLSDDPPENFVRPAADPLFRSASTFFGRYCIGVVLTGMGRDGSKGVVHVKAAGGLVFAQDPETAVANSMPKNAIATGSVAKVFSLPQMSEAIAAEVNRLSAELDLKSRNPR
jgi:two-component system chemotaxis response regulator CheB